MIKPFVSILSLLGIAFILQSCEKSDGGYAKEPEITYVGMSMNHIYTSTDSGSWYLHYKFVDGDGDLGTIPDDIEMRVFLKNLKTGAEYLFPFPYISGAARSGKKYLKGDGEIRLDIPTFFQIPAGQEADTLTFSLMIKDQAGNESNVIVTPEIYVNP